MLQIAIISDIHANSRALEAVLHDIDQRHIAAVYCLGDLVDFAPWGNEVIERIRKRGIPTLLGNHDERIAFDEPVVALPHHDAHESANRVLAIQYSKEHITAENKKWMASLPYTMTLRFKVGEQFKSILLVHANLDSNDQYVYEGDDKQDMAARLKARGIDAVFMGHTHLSYVQELDEVLFVNAGSVGRSREEDRKACYTVVTLTETEIKVAIVKLDYAIDEVAQAIYSSEIPDFYGDFLLQR